MPPGRPRAFREEDALDSAMRVFWRHGFEATTVAMLTEAMGINAPSLYSAFGNKEQLFAKAMQRYLAEPASYLRRALEQPTARQVAEAIFAGAIDMAMQPQNPPGCMLVRGALVAGPSCEAIRQQLSEYRKGAEAHVCRRLERAVAEGDLPASGAEPAQLAGYIMTLIWGMSVQAAGGASRDQLEAVANQAMRAWPST